MTFRAPGQQLGSDSDFGRWAGRAGTEGTKGGAGPESRLNGRLQARKPPQRAFQGPKSTFRGLSGPQGIKLARIRISEGGEGKAGGGGHGRTREDAGGHGRT